jgi:hypothetical protein
MDHAWELWFCPDEAMLTPCSSSYSPEHDILLGCVDGSEWEKIRLAVVPLKHRFQHIAIGAETLEAIVEHKPGLYGDLRKLAGLKKITLIWNHQKQTQEGGHMKFVKDEDAERKANTGKVTKLTKMLEEQREGWNKPKVNVAHIEFN